MLNCDTCLIKRRKTCISCLLVNIVICLARFCDEDRKCICTNIMNKFRTNLEHSKLHKTHSHTVELKSVIYYHYMGLYKITLNFLLNTSYSPWQISMKLFKTFKKNIPETNVAAFIF
jgi:hypothetical protein